MTWHCFSLFRPLSKGFTVFWVCVEGEKRAQHVQTACCSGAEVQKSVYEPTNIDAYKRFGMQISSIFGTFLKKQTPRWCGVVLCLRKTCFFLLCSPENGF